MGFSSNFMINLNESFFILDNFVYLFSIKSIFQSILEKNAERNALSDLIRSSSWSWSLTNMLEFDEKI